MQVFKVNFKSPRSGVCQVGAAYLIAEGKYRIKSYFGEVVTLPKSEVHEWEKVPIKNPTW